MKREEMTCPGCGVWVYLSRMDGWRNDAYGYTCEPPSTTHSMHIVPALIRRGVLDDLSDKVGALIEATEKEAEGQGRDHPTARTIALIRAQGMREALALFDGSNE